MSQSEVIRNVTASFASRLALLNTDESGVTVCLQEPDIPDSKSAGGKIILRILGVEEITNANPNEKHQKKEKDENGNIIEYFVSPPSMAILKYMLTPVSNDPEIEFSLLGKIIRLIKDENTISIDGHDWEGNRGLPVVIRKSPDMDIGKQFQLFSVLGIPYKPSLFYEMEIGIDSEKKEIFRRVEERKITADIKKETGKNQQKK